MGRASAHPFPRPSPSSCGKIGGDRCTLFWVRHIMSPPPARSCVCDLFSFRSGYGQVPIFSLLLLLVIIAVVVVVVVVVAFLFHLPSCSCPRRRRRRRRHRRRRRRSLVFFSCLFLFSLSDLSSLSSSSSSCPLFFFFLPFLGRSLLLRKERRAIRRIGGVQGGRRPPWFVSLAL